MCLEWLRSRICEGYISPPNYLEDIGSSEVIGIINAEFIDGIKLVSDRDFKTTTKEELMRFLKEDITDKFGYINEYYDCDDFAFHLMGQISNQSWGCLPFGILYIKKSNGSLHALNCFIDKDRELWIIEPQNDSIYVRPKSWQCVMLLM